VKTSEVKASEAVTAALAEAAFPGSRSLCFGLGCQTRPRLSSSSREAAVQVAKGLHKPGCREDSFLSSGSDARMPPGLLQQRLPELQRRAAHTPGITWLTKTHLALVAVRRWGHAMRLTLNSHDNTKVAHVPSS